MQKTNTMPKGWDNLSPLAKASYVDADYVERVDDAIYEASIELNQNIEETKNMSAKEYARYCMGVLHKHTDKVE